MFGVFMLEERAVVEYLFHVRRNLAGQEVTSPTDIPMSSFLAIRKRSPSESIKLCGEMS